MSQTELAPKLGITQSGLSRKLRGVNAFGIDELVDVAELLRVDLADLLPTKVYDDETPPDDSDGASVSRLRESNSRPFHYKGNRAANFRSLSDQADLEDAA